MTGFAPGDHVYGFSHGAFAEFVAVPQGKLARKPANLTFEQAAALHRPARLLRAVESPLQCFDLGAQPVKVLVEARRQG